MWTQLLLLPVATLLTGTPAPAPEAAAPCLAVDAATEDDYETLEAEFEAALDAHRREHRKLRGEEREALEAERPALTFWPRFEALALAGDGRALFWMAANARERADSITAGREETVRLYQQLIAKHADAPWFARVIERLPKERLVIGTSTVQAALRRALQINEDRDVKALSLVALAGELRRSKEPQAVAEAQELLDRVAAEFADTELGAKVANQLRLRVGAIAPDFEGQTIDGYEFKLSDYRGKVVLVDFYGFW